MLDEKFKPGFDNDHDWRWERNSQIFAYSLALEMLKLDDKLPDDILRRLRVVVGIGPVFERDILELGFEL